MNQNGEKKKILSLFYLFCILCSGKVAPALGAKKPLWPPGLVAPDFGSGVQVTVGSETDVYQVKSKLSSDWYRRLRASFLIRSMTAQEPMGTKHLLQKGGKHLIRSPSS